ncbi:hypothetical protein DABAL43B_1444 [Psychrobacter sp. DAB_AL43B]|nr:hypothetical protein DABAL43B_1444 [Psychrobacter sp. DAB_AL43B]
MQPSFIQPIVGMMGVTAGVWGWMYIKRLRYLQTEGIDPQSIRTPAKLTALLPESVNLPAYNLQNLFEMPVLFYVICLSAELLRIQDMTLTNWLYQAAWAFVILRAVHSVIQCSYNQVMHRFIVYILSCATLWIMAIKMATIVF